LGLNAGIFRETPHETETPKQDVDLIKKRYKEAQEHAKNEPKN
jgi:phage-related protein